jgi:hypothetical protein
MRRRPTVGDVLLLVLLVAAVPLSRRATAAAAGGGPERLVLRSEPAGMQVVDARRDGEYELRGPLGATRLRLRGGRAWIVESPCPGQLCRRMGRISGPGRVLACIPNRVLVEFEGRAAEVDGVSR